MFNNKFFGKKHLSNWAPKSFYVSMRRHQQFRFVLITLVLGSIILCLTGCISFY